MNKGFIPPSKSSIKSFTLIELIVVIIIVGILAAVGLTQYSKTVEKGRGAEARMIIGQIRTLAYQYRLEKGTLTGMTVADVNIGTGEDQIPSVCRSSHYFRYTITIGPPPDPALYIYAYRCNGGGKSPQGTYAIFNPCCGYFGDCLWLSVNFLTGVDTWYHCRGTY